MATMRSKDEILAESRKLREKIEKKHGKSVEQLYEEREKRVRDAIELKVPDRVPVWLGMGNFFFAARYCGLTTSSMYYDQAAFREAGKKTFLDFEPDIIQGSRNVSSGLILELLDSKTNRWPGGNLPADAPQQFVEGEYMKADEYDWFLSDPSDFVFRGYLPRTHGTLEPLSKLPPFRTMIGGTGLTASLGLFARPEFKELAGKIYQAAQEHDRLRKDLTDFDEEMARLGFPSRQGAGGAGGAPFDMVSDNLRGMRGTMLDMYRCPDKLLATCDRILEWRIAQAVPANPKTRGNPKMSGGALHRGSDGFMSLKQFETFYWPGLKKATLVNIELGYAVSHFFEGVWDQRLEYLLELPKGKVIFHCEKTDLFRAKEILGEHMCIQGGVPPTLLEVGTPQEVEEHCQKMIKIVGKNGGLILGPGSAIDEAKPANIRAMVESVKKYGWY